MDGTLDSFVKHRQQLLAKGDGVLPESLGDVSSVGVQSSSGASEVSAKNVDIPPRFYGSVVEPKDQRVMQIQQDYKV